MRENYTWATDCGPVVGEIKNGKRYPNGAVPAEDYAKDMAAVSENINAVKEAISALNGAEVALETKVDALVQNYNGTVPGLQADTTALKVSLAELKASIASLSGEVTANANKEISDIEAVMERIAEVTAGVNSLADLVHEHSEAIAATNATVSGHTSSISIINNAVSGINNKLAELDGEITDAYTQMNLNKVDADGKIAQTNTAVSNLTANVDSLSSLAQEHSEAIAINTATVANHGSTISSILASINSINSAITNVSNDLAQAKINLSAQIGTVSGRVDGIDTTVTNLTSTVNAANAQMNARIAEVSNANKENEKDIAALKTVAMNLSVGIDEANGNIKSIGTRMTTLEVAMATLRNQQLNTTNQLTDSINVISNDITVLRRDLAGVQTNINELAADTANAMAAVNKRIDDLEGKGTSVSIKSFTASPNICELGGTENIVLAWSIDGDIAEIKINGEVVTGNSKTMPNVTGPTRFTLSVKGTNGSVASKSVDVVFINHIFWGTNTSTSITKSLVKALQNEAFSDDVNRDVTLEPAQDYVYYAYPKRLGSVICKVGQFEGGFEQPAVVSVDNHSGYSEDYYVYRSSQKLNGRAKFEFRKG